MIRRRAFIDRYGPPRKARPVRSSVPLKRTRIKHKPKKNPMPLGRRMEIFERDGWQCRCCHNLVNWGDSSPFSGHAHHIIFKSHGVDHSAANLILLCAGCHYRVHHTGNEKFWLWISGNATTARFLTERP